MRLGLRSFLVGAPIPQGPLAIAVSYMATTYAPREMREWEGPSIYSVPDEKTSQIGRPPLPPLSHLEMPAPHSRAAHHRGRVDIPQHWLAGRTPHRVGGWSAAPLEHNLSRI